MYRLNERFVLPTVLAVTCLTFVAGVTNAGCAGNPVPILVGNAAIGVTDSLNALSVAGKQLTEAAILPPAIALGFQEKLLAANDKLKPLPELLRIIDRLQQAEQSTSADTDKAIAILMVVGQDISIVIGGVPMSEATTALITLIRAAQKTVHTVLVEVAKIQGRE